MVGTIHSDPKLDYLGRPLSNLTYGAANRAALRHLDDWICVSRQLRDMMVEAGVDPRAAFVINNGVDFSHIHAPVGRGDFWKAHGLQVEPDSVVFGIAARISPVKDIGSLIRAFAAAVSQEPGIRLAIAGDGEQRKELEQLAAKLCPAGTVAFLGWLTDTDSFYNALATSPFLIFAAMSLLLACPVVISPVTGRFNCPIFSSSVILFINTSMKRSISCGDFCADVVRKPAANNRTDRLNFLYIILL